jgi:hypothetical protein
MHSSAASLRRRIYRSRNGRFDFRQNIDIILSDRRISIFYIGSYKFGEGPETSLEYTLIPEL